MPHIKKMPTTYEVAKSSFEISRMYIFKKSKKNLICTRCPGCQKKRCLTTGLSGLTFYAIKHKNCVRVIIKTLVFLFFTVLFQAFASGRG